MENASEDESQIEAALRQARMELRGIDSIRRNVQRRVERVRMRPGVPRSLLSVAGMVLVGVAVVWVGRQRARPAARAEPPKLVAGSEPCVVLDLGDVRLTEHLAAFVDDRAVVVIWTSKGTSQVPAAAGNDGNYQEIPLARAPTRDGQTLRCALFVPQPGTRPGLDPPEIAARLPGNQVVRLSALPAVMTRRDLGGAIRAAARSAHAEGRGDELAAAVAREMR
ncbi:MAG TPA: hypothetical protein VGI81_18160 [Tepidisphaeraceae bacterium]|jgi:hypothetical protein